jgi:Fur family transcriptional regulator, ferric uptake regulator
MGEIAGMCTSTDAGQWRGLGLGERREITTTLRERGLYLTAQREAVCEAVFGCPGHICAEHIQRTVAARHPDLRMNKTTIYRTLALLMELGLVTEHRCGDGPVQYEPAARGRHSHAICRRCGELLHLDDDVAASLRDSLRARHGFQVDLESYPVSGLCASCR